MHSDNMLAWAILFAISWAGAAFTIRRMLTDKQPNPAYQFSCVTDLVIAPPLMLALGVWGMVITVIVHLGVMFGGQFLTLRK